MSTDMQAHSLDNQRAALADFAEREGFDITHTYADPGRSGLTLRHRPALQALLEDVERGPDFEILLVYDVSRFGRFQDVDESAFYEFQCRRAGVKVIYSEEPFEGDRSPMGAVYKTIKRAMAGEYSRELSAKVSRGHRHLSGKGFWQGGPAGYGLSRAVLGADGEVKGYLQRGEEKFSRSDMTTLRRGQESEVQAVREVYRLYCTGLDRVEIARRMNEAKLPTVRGGRWWPSHVRLILTNPKYAGHYVYGRTTQLLKSPVRPAPADLWVRVENVFEPIIDQATFDLAQRIRLARSGMMTREDMIDRLQVLLARHGKLTRHILEADLETPSPNQYVGRFGDIAAAYAAAGWRSDKNLEAKIAGARLAASRRRQHNVLCREAAEAGEPPPLYRRLKRRGARKGPPSLPALTEPSS